MLAEFLQKVADMALQGRRFSKLDNGVGPHIALLDTEGGEVKFALQPPPLRDHVLLNLDAVIAAVKEFAFIADASPNPKNPEDSPSVWYSRAGVTVLVNDADRRDKLQLRLQFTPQLKTLFGWEAKAPVGVVFSQADLIWTLRTLFRNCLDASPNLVPILRSITWKSGEEGASTVSHGAASLGKKVQAEMGAAQPIPDYFTLCVPIFVFGVPLQWMNIDVALEPDPKTQSFRLLPVAGSIEDAILRAEESIGFRLKDSLKDIPCAVHYGSP